ncbi:MAG: phosphatase PAP2 family protein [Candidatus Microthrix sp.]|nr:phosphatase PAP2 family protein [Candidatus Microthrix sp.]
MSGRRWLTAVAGVYALGMALAAVITRGAVDRFDERTTAELRRWVASHPAVGEVAAKLTIIGSPIVLVAVVLAGAVWLEGRGDRRAAITLVLIGGLGAMVETALKVTIARARPELDPLVFARGSSFPSGHAMNSMIVLVATARLLAGGPRTSTDGAAPRRRVGIATGAALAVAIPIGVSRVALGVHHPGDVVSGWVLAALWLTLTLGEARLPSEASPLAAGERLADRTHGEAGQHQRDAAGDRCDADPQHQQDDRPARIADGPDSHGDLEQGEQQGEPPQVHPGALGFEGADDADDAPQQQQPGHQRGDDGKCGGRPDEGDDSGADSEHPEDQGQ